MCRSGLRRGRSTGSIEAINAIVVLERPMNKTLHRALALVLYWQLAVSVSVSATAQPQDKGDGAIDALPKNIRAIFDEA